MSNRYTAKVAESLKLRGWIDEIQAKSLQTELDHLRQDKKNSIPECALTADLQRHKSCLEVARGALERIWEIEEMGYTPDDPESESAVCVCDKCEGVQHHNHASHAENCPQPIIESTLHQINEVLGGDSTKPT